MARRCGLVGIIIASCCCFLLLMSFNQQDDRRRIVSYPEQIQDDYIIQNITTENSLKDIIKHQQSIIENELLDYNFPTSTNLRNFTLATGGQPVRSIIVTTWRSGSTFLGDVLNSVPGNFYHYEPLLDYGIVQIRGPPLAESAINNLKNLLTCDYKDLSNYLEYGKTHIYLFTHNTRLWAQCDNNSKYCWNSTFVSEICQQYPFQSMKIVRLRLKLAEELLKDKM